MLCRKRYLQEKIKVSPLFFTQKAHPLMYTFEWFLLGLVIAIFIGLLKWYASR
jgi:hypothetical protein